MPDPDLADELISTTPEGLREQALRSLKKRRDFHTHLFVFVTFNAVVWIIWAFTGASDGGVFPWPLWITLFWGIGVIFNAYDVYVRRPISEEDVEREVQRLAHHD